MERVVVIGSVNADYILSVDIRPVPGETVVATEFRSTAGGKGANQAAAAARADAKTVFIGAVGNDAAAAGQIAQLEKLGIDTEHVIVLPDAATGSAFITVTPDGENMIVVASGANALLDADMVIAALARCPQPTLVMLQTETPSGVVEAVAEWCAAHEIRVAINNGPYVKLSIPTQRVADPLIVNEHEARQLCDDDVTVATADLANRVFERSGARSVVVTLGADGVALRNADISIAIPAGRVERVVDTTGAGDTFVGTLAARLATGSSLREAAEHAVAAAALSVSWSGARPPADAASPSIYEKSEQDAC